MQFVSFKKDIDDLILLKLIIAWMVNFFIAET